MDSFSRFSEYSPCRTGKRLLIKNNENANWLPQFCWKKVGKVLGHLKAVEGRRGLGLSVTQNGGDGGDHVEI